MIISCALITFIISAPVQLVAHSAELDNVQIPETLQVEGKTLHLNGYGRRTYSLYAVHIYVASLYLEHPNSIPEDILRSSETKLLIVKFEHNVSLYEARKAWQVGLANNCISPCHLDADDVEQFLAMVPAMHEGDNCALL